MQMLFVDVNFLSLKCSSLGHSSSSSYVLVKSDLPTQVSQFGEHCVTHCVLLQPEPIKGECAHHVTLVKPIKSEKLPKTTTEEQSERRRRENTTHTQNDDVVMRVRDYSRKRIKEFNSFIFSKGTAGHSFFPRNFFVLAENQV